jgi:hypothetical protein
MATKRRQGMYGEIWWGMLGKWPPGRLRRLKGNIMMDFMVIICEN